MPEIDPSQPDLKPQVIPPATRPAVLEEHGSRPLPWPLWQGRYGSTKAAVIVFGLWLVSLSAAAFLKNFALNNSASTSALFSAFVSLLERTPWTFAVLWLLWGGRNYGLALLLICGWVGKPSVSSVVGEPIALAVFASLQVAFPFDTRLRNLPSFGLFVFASFCAAATVALSGLVRDDAHTLLNWERVWITHVSQDLALTAPLIFLLGPTIEYRKRIHLGSLPLLRGNSRQQFYAFAISMLLIITFCVAWTIAADAPVQVSLHEFITDPTVRSQLNDSYRTAALRKAALVALLLGSVCGGASLVILLIKRYREILRNEVQNNTEGLRRRHIQLATLQQVTESASRSLEPEGVMREMTQHMARLTDAAQVTLYIQDPQDPDHLKLVEQVCIRPPDFKHRQRLSMQGSITGQCFRTGSIVNVQSNLPVYVGIEKIRAVFQKYNLEAMLAVPISTDNRVLGVVSLTFDRKYAPDEEDHRLFRLIGRAVGAALERAETHAKARRYAGDLGGLYRFSQQLAAESDEAPLLAAAAPSARQLLDADLSAIFLATELREESATETVSAKLRCVAIDGTGEKIERARQLSGIITDSGLIHEAVRESRTVSVGLRTHSDEPQVIMGTWLEKMALIVPLPRAANDPGPAGAFVWTFNQSDAVGPETAGLAEEIARQTAAGLRRARLIRQTRQQATELKLLEQIGRTLAQRLSMSDTLEQTVQNTNKIVNAKWASIFVHDPTTQTLRTRITNMPTASDIAIPLSAKSFVVTCLKDGKTLISPDMFNDPRCNQELNRKHQTASGICVPLGPPGQRFGVLMVNNPTPCQFTRVEVERLEQVAQLASAAIERARLYEEACQRADDLILLNEVGHLLVENPALESTLQRISDLVRRNFQLEGAGFLLLNENRDALISRGISGEHSPRLKQLLIPLSTEDVTTLAFKQNQTLVVENGGADPRIHRMLRKLLPGATSGAVIPMAGSRGPAGILAVWRSKAKAFHPRDLQSLAGIARLAAAAVGRDELGQALRASEKRLQDVVDGIHALIVSVDAQGKISSFNAAAERLSGYGREEALGQSLSKIVNPKPIEQARLEMAIQRAFADDDCSKELLLNWATPDGLERKIRWSSSFLNGPDGKPGGMVCFGIDITEQILLEAQLLQAQKMESVGALAGGMAHDFNNLLGGIIGQCTLASAQTSDPLMLGSFSKIEAAAHRGADLTSKLMAFARKSVLQPRPVDLAALIRETTELLSGSLPRSIRIVTHLPPALPRVHGDATQLQQILLNLCVNARDAMPDGGTLTISASAAASPPRPDGSSSSNMLLKGVLVEISDTGTGMSDEVQQHLFEPFFTTKAPGKGTGLGLSVVFGIVRSHGGQINVDSHPGKGTKFSIRLPSARVISGTLRQAGSHSELPAITAGSSQLQSAVSFAGRENILLIDDDSILRETMRQLLQSLGYYVRTGLDGADTLRLLDGDSAFKPNIILLDVVMPGLSGLALFNEIRKRLPAVPVVLMSGYSADQTVRDLLDAGALELIQKPFTIETLAGAVRRAVEQVPHNR
jgi:two-component system, cell cycle sensor histidine kinase and response regulator CckA